jgi:DNA-binding transcriptional MerR regulator
MRIGELARRVGVSTDTVRFYERAGWLPKPARQHGNDYRQYGEGDVEHLQLLIELRRLGIPLDDAARLAGWCHSGHCADAGQHLPALIAARRAEISDRITGLRELDRRLADLQAHLAEGKRRLQVVGGPTSCCEAAGAVLSTAGGSCGCSPPIAPA